MVSVTTESSSAVTESVESRHSVGRAREASALSLGVGATSGNEQAAHYRAERQQLFDAQRQVSLSCQL